MTVEAPVLVVCSACGGEYELSARNARLHRRQGTPLICRLCRYGPKTPDPRRLEAMRAWWLARYSLAKLQSWPPL